MNTETYTEAVKTAVIARLNASPIADAAAVLVGTHYTRIYMDATDIPEDEMACVATSTADWADLLFITPIDLSVVIPHIADIYEELDHEYFVDIIAGESQQEVIGAHELSICDRPSAIALHSV